ncbi:Myophilin [Phytophthora citrophthora]|uniref:Myophilin n=1 Tax=Phytophthora citrophthora TaxID=4793 RepID=A0AAD9FYR7_9STRA|nr:Myophilin [Phytophthora citrophthora]
MSTQRTSTEPRAIVAAMDMDLILEMPNHEGDVRSSPMGGKHQRSLSLSAKWASDKSMAIEYLRRQREVMTWIESVLKRQLPTTDLYEALKSGVVLREMMETLFPDVSNCMSPISRNYSNRMAPWKERENISVFLRQCKSIGMNDLSLFCTDDLYEGTNMVQVLFCVQHFMMFSEENAGDLFLPIAMNEPAEFSNQEVRYYHRTTGVDAKALKGLISPNSSVMEPEKAAVQVKQTTARAVEPTSVPLKDEKLENVNAEEPAEITEEKISVQVQPEVCNQLAEDKQDVDNPADDEDVNPEQETESEAADDDDVGLEDSDNVIKQEAIITEELFGGSSSIDMEIEAIIHEVLMEMAAVIEAAAIEAQSIVAQIISVCIPRVKLVANVETVAAIEEMEAVVVPVATEVMAESIDQANVQVEVTEGTETPAENVTSTPPTESTPIEEAIGTQPTAETTEMVEPVTENATPQQTDEELEAKAMAKCMCGRCTIM